MVYLSRVYIQKHTQKYNEKDKQKHNNPRVSRLPVSAAAAAPLVAANTSSSDGGRYVFQPPDIPLAVGPVAPRDVGNVNSKALEVVEGTSTASAS